MTTAETKIGIRITGSSHARPGTSVRAIRKASPAPSGTAIAVMPAASSKVVPKAVQNSGSASTNA